MVITVPSLMSLYEGTPIVSQSSRYAHKVMVKRLPYKPHCVEVPHKVKVVRVPP